MIIKSTKKHLANTIFSLALSTASTLSSYSGETSEIHDATQLSDIDKIAEIISRNPDAINLTDDCGFMPIHLATQDGDIDLINTLIEEYGADVNSKTEIGITPIHMAAEDGYLSLIIDLIALGAKNINLEHIGWTDLHWAIATSNEDEVKLILSSKWIDVNKRTDAGLTPLVLAIAAKNLNIVKLLIAEGADIDAKEKNVDIEEFDQTISTYMALEYAAHTNQYEIVEFLLSYGANPNAENETESVFPITQASHITNETDSIKIIKLLIEYGADINALSINGPAIEIAAMNNSIVCLKELIDMGADYSCLFDSLGWNDLHWLALQDGGTQLLKKLLQKYNYDINSTTKNGVTALHIATSLGNLRLVCNLLNNGANKEIKNYQGMNANDIASKNGNAKIYAALFNHKN